MSRPVFVVFEGLDGAGKTTCAEHLARQIGAVCMCTPSEAIRKFRDELIGSFDGCQEAAQLFYLSTVFAASQRVKQHLAAGRSVVMDRYFLSTQVYAHLRGTRLELDGLQGKLVPASVTVFLDAPLALRAERLKVRRVDAADRETLAPAADRFLRQQYRARAHHAVVGQWLELDSAALSVAAIGERIVETIGLPGQELLCGTQRYCDITRKEHHD